MFRYSFRQRCILIILLLATFTFVYKYNYIEKYYLTDEHRIYASLLTELPHLERLIRVKQANLTSIQNRLRSVEKHLSRNIWHLNRLIKTIDYNKREQKRIYRFNSFDFDLEMKANDNHTKFLVYFHSINFSNELDYDVLNAFHSTISMMNSPYITLNKSEAYLHIIYLPIRFYQPNICYRNLIDEKYIVLYEFLNPINENIDEKCFHGKFFPVKFFTRFHENSTFINNNHWLFNIEQRRSIGIVYLSSNCKLKNEC